jgi:hypothetical protein
VIKGIGVVTCVSVHPDTDQCWLLDSRIYDPDGAGKSKLDHMREMLTKVVYQKSLPFQAVLMETWYATKDLMLFIESLDKNYYCPLKDNRQVDDASGARAYQRVDALDWSDHDLAHGKQFPLSLQAQCSRGQLHWPFVSLDAKIPPDVNVLIFS